MRILVRYLESEWSGDAENAYFSSETFDKHRVLLQPETEWSGKAKNGYYVIGVDVGRIGCTTECVVFKVAPQVQGTALKSVVNIFTYEAEHFEAQAIKIKRLYYKFKAKKIALDGNGLGAGLLDYMVKMQVDPDTGEELPPFGIENDEKGIYKQFRTSDMEDDAIYVIKANAPLNTEAHAYVQAQLFSGKIKFLIDERQAKVKLMEKKVGQLMDLNKRAEHLRPFTLTTVLREQMLNLVEENEGTNIILKRASRNIKSDKFSAFEYGLYYIKKEEDKRRSKKKYKISDLVFFSQS